MSEAESSAYIVAESAEAVTREMLYFSSTAAFLSLTAREIISGALSSPVSSGEVETILMTAPPQSTPATPSRYSFACAEKSSVTPWYGGSVSGAVVCSISDV